ncbi:MAG: hypothetical protein CMH98_16365 [Oceanospirillaceae bacterium]|nr:hypothetical protein [Oceanospirillaceae bacterium]
MAEHPTQLKLDQFYKKYGPCCAGCDHWRWHNSVVGECTKSAPVSGQERWSAVLQLDSASTTLPAGCVMTERDHHCGDFIDTYDWEGGIDEQ